MSDSAEIWYMNTLWVLGATPWKGRNISNPCYQAVCGGTAHTLAGSMAVALKWLQPAFSATSELRLQ